MKTRKTDPNTPKEIGQYTAELWLSAGTITIADRGEENTYYVDSFGNRFFCKNRMARSTWG